MKKLLLTLVCTTEFICTSSAQIVPKTPLVEHAKSSIAEQEKSYINNIILKIKSLIFL